MSGNGHPEGLASSERQIGCRGLAEGMPVQEQERTNAWLVDLSNATRQSPNKETERKILCLAAVLVLAIVAVAAINSVDTRGSIKGDKAVNEAATIAPAPANNPSWSPSWAPSSSMDLFLEGLFSDTTGDLFQAHPFNPAEHDEEWPGEYPSAPNAITIKILTDALPVENRLGWKMQDEYGIWLHLEDWAPAEPNSVRST